MLRYSTFKNNDDQNNCDELIGCFIDQSEKMGSAAVLSRLTSRERRFIQFASTEYCGQLYMTPQDFLESVIEAEPRRTYQSSHFHDIDIQLVSASLGLI